MKSIFDIHKKLGLVTQENGKEVNKDGLCTRKKLKDTSGNNIFDLYDKNVINYKSNDKVEYSLKKLAPHSFFLFNNEPLLLFFDNPKKSIEDLSKDIWNFNKSALIFVNRPQELRIYNGFNYEKSGLLEVFETINNVTDFDKLNQYSYWKIVTAELWNTKDEKFKNNTRVDKKLLDNIKVARNILIGKDKNEQIENPLHEKHANRIIGRLIFIRYLIDRKVNFDYGDNGNELLTKDELPYLILQKEKLFTFFEYLLDKFKGNILPLNGEKDDIQQNHLEILSRLFAGDNIKNRQRSLFNIFDFDFIPVELISNIYETFLSETQDRDKAFYTPPFLVDYVLSQTVKPFIDKQTNAELISCKTTDMTCGSGIFLCETLRTIINKYVELASPNHSSKEFKKTIKQLLKDNIFGNDINQEAVEIAKFSLFITLLDYFESPKDIADFEFPDISGNFYNEDVFSCKLDDIFGENKKIEPDFILGNPPWGKLYEKSDYIDYCKDRASNETIEKKERWLKENKDLSDFKPVEIKISNKEFAQAFLLRLSDFSTEKTVCQVIVTS
ncbi:MAG: N-6 DNA methylase, partial [Actinomycetia bacterium]|nr:N-6 DNA methylase [Actinomycetes bacterium]